MTASRVMAWRTGSLRVVVFCAVFGADFLTAMISSLSLRGVPPAHCLRPPPRVRFSEVGQGWSRKPPEGGSGAEVARLLWRNFTVPPEPQALRPP